MINGHFKAIKRQNRDNQRDYTSDLAIAHCGLRSSHNGLLWKVYMYMYMYIAHSPCWYG